MRKWFLVSLTALMVFCAALDAACFREACLDLGQMQAQKAPKGGFEIVALGLSCAGKGEAR